MTTPLPPTDLSATPMTDTIEKAPLSDTDIAEIGARAEKATAGPWEHVNGKGYAKQYECVETEDVMVCECWDAGSDEQRHADAAFIAHAREDVPKLLSALKAAREDNERLRACEIALLLTEISEAAHAECPECEGEGEAEACEKCFDHAYEARCARRAAIGLQNIMPVAVDPSQGRTLNQIAFAVSGGKYRTMKDVLAFARAAIQEKKT